MKYRFPQDGHILEMHKSYWVGADEYPKHLIQMKWYGYWYYDDKGFKCEDITWFEDVE